MNTPLVISALVFLLCFVVILVLASYLQMIKVRREWTERLEGKPTLTHFEQLKQMLQFSRSAMLEFMRQFGSVTSKDNVQISKCRERLVTAGYRGLQAAYVFAAVRIIAAVCLPLIVLVMRPDSLRLLPQTISIALYVALALVGYYTPNLWLDIAVKRRQRRLMEGFPNALDLIVVCIESGLGLGPAIQRVGQELRLAHPELSEEFQLLAVELRTGSTRQQALRNLANRTGLEDVKSMVGMLIQTDRFGTSVGEAMRVHSDFMRKTRQFRAEELAAKLPVKMIFPLIFFIFPSFFVVIMGPAVIRIVRFMLPALAQ